MTDIDTPTHELSDELRSQRSVNTTVPVEQAQKNAQDNGGATSDTPPEQDDLPHLPHERDQSVGMTDGNPSPKVQQAYKDVTRGLVDTDEAKRAHSVGKPVNPPEPSLPGTPGPVEPDHK